MPTTLRPLPAPTSLPSQIYVNVSIYTVKEYKDAHASLWALSMSCKPNLTSWLQGTLPWAHPFQLCQGNSADRTQLLTKVPGAEPTHHTTSDAHVSHMASVPWQILARHGKAIPLSLLFSLKHFDSCQVTHAHHGFPLPRLELESELRCNCVLPWWIVLNYFASRFRKEFRMKTGQQELLGGKLFSSSCQTDPTIFQPHLLTVMDALSSQGAGPKVLDLCHTLRGCSSLDKSWLHQGLDSGNPKNISLSKDKLWWDCMGLQRLWLVETCRDFMSIAWFSESMPSLNIGQSRVKLDRLHQPFKDDLGFPRFPHVLSTSGRTRRKHR